jgi:hypothetical protein
MPMKMSGQPAKATSLPSVDHKESQLSPAGLEYDIAAAADDHPRSASFLRAISATWCLNGIHEG